MKFYKMECGCQFPIVEEREGKLPLIAYDIRNCNYSCPLVWSMLGKGLTKGIFQLDSHLGKQWCKRLKPTCVEHFAALTAIMRPGALQLKDEKGVSATEKYCRRKNGEEPVELIHPIIDKILSSTYGLWCYQEQIMQIAKEIAGFDLVGVDELRKAVGGKDQTKLARVGEKFIAGVEKCGIVDKELGLKTWQGIKASGRYLFNLAHSWAYSTNGYWTALYKSHFPLYFFTSYLRNAYEEQEPFEEIRELINEAKLFELEVKTPSILNTKKHFDTDGEKIYFGLVDIKGVGESHFAKMAESFKQGKPTCWFEFLSKHSGNLGAAVCEKFIKAGALDSISKISRNQMLDELNKFALLSPTEKAWVVEHHSEYATFTDLMVGLARPKKEGGGCHNKNRLAMCLDIIKLLREPTNSLVDDPNWITWNEKLLLGESITCSKVDGCDTTSSNCTCKEFLAGRGKSGRYKDLLILAVTITNAQELTIKTGDNKGKPYMRMTVQDNTGSIDAVVWSETLSENSDLLFPDNVVLLMGSRDKRDGFTVESVSQL